MFLQLAEIERVLAFNEDDQTELNQKIFVSDVLHYLVFLSSNNLEEIVQDAYVRYEQNNYKN